MSTQRYSMFPSYNGVFAKKLDSTDAAQEVGTVDMWVKNDDYIKAMEAKDAELAEKDREIARLKKQRDSAIAYIDESPSDPDIYPEQYEAWRKYQQICHGKQVKSVQEQLS